MSEHMDYIYFDEDYLTQPKEIFSFMLKQVKKGLPAKDPLRILDLGCARGELLHFLQQSLGENHEYLGLDASSALIANAQNNTALRNIEFVVGDAENFELNKEVDIILSLGVAGYFDSLQPTMRMIAKHLSSQGSCYLCHLFNEHDIDVRVKYRHNQRFEEFQPGWNLHSLKTAERDAASQGLEILEVNRFELSFIDSPKQDPARSWTMDKDERRWFVNGLGQIYSIFCVEIKKP